MAAELDRGLMRRAALALGLLAALAACDGEDPVDAALRDAAAARQAEALKVTGESEAPKPDRPALSADQVWVEATIRDHRKAIAEAEEMLAKTDNAAVRDTAEEVIATRKREIAQLEALRPGAGPAE
ncbi:DUF305 domain-containing protein [Brevundimonas sp. Root1279]|uniref:DUF305 domain-containing protein n=1 Tax=Brevundimonas sp. Root1279 TaxID=1736443 RepID=UPI0012E3B740|nr:DUF305 domain-containing protein [Brevundimonas sp. Root1279]